MLERGALGSFRRPRSAEGWGGWRSLCWADMRMVIWQLSSHGAWVKRTGPSVISFHHCSLLPADLQTWVICLWPSACLCASASHSAYKQDRITLTPAADPNRDDLGFVRQPSIHPRSVSVFLAAVLFQSRLPRLSPVRVCVRVSHGWRSTCTCQVQWRWHLMPRAEIMKALTSQLKHIRLRRRGLSDTRSQHEWSEWVATLHFTCAERCAL